MYTGLTMGLLCSVWDIHALAACGAHAFHKEIQGFRTFPHTTQEFHQRRQDHRVATTFLLECGGQSTSNGTSDAGARSGSNWDQLSLRDATPVFRRKCSFFASGKPLKSAARRFVLRLRSSFLRPWRPLEWNFPQYQKLFRCDNFPRPNGRKLSAGT